MKIITLKETEFDQYANKHKYRSYYQSTAYGRTMQKFGYDTHYLGIMNDHGNLIGATLLLYREVFMNYKIAYAPRGMLIEYSNQFQLKELLERLKKLLGKQGFMLLKFDPLIPINLRNKDGQILNHNQETEIILENLKNLNLQYHGQTLFFETEKPRFEALITLQQDIKEIYHHFEKRVRYKIKKAIRSGVEIYRGTENDLPTFFEFVKRKHDRPLTYYQELYQNFDKQSELFLAKLNTETFVISSKQLYEKELDNNDNLAQQIQKSQNNIATRKKLINEKIESDKLINIYKKNLVWATNLLKQYPKGLIIGGAFIICYDNAAFLVIEGFDSKFKTLNPNYLIKWEMINNYKKRNFKYINLNAVSGEFQQANNYSGLNEMKLGFHSVITEYIGEFDYIISQLPYNLYKNLNKDKKK